MVPRKNTIMNKTPTPATIAIILDNNQFKIEHVNLPYAKIDIPKIDKVKLGLRINFLHMLNKKLIDALLLFRITIV